MVLHSSCHALRSQAVCCAPSLPRGRRAHITTPHLQWCSMGMGRCSSGAVWVGWGCVGGLGVSCSLDVHWTELRILEGKGEKKKHILRLLWRFGDLYQKAALMESLGGGSEKHRFFHCLPGCACAELAAGDLPTHGVHRLGTRSQKSLLVKFWT